LLLQLCVLEHRGLRLRKPCGPERFPKSAQRFLVKSAA
jgi:hypothetical protein